MGRLTLLQYLKDDFHDLNIDDLLKKDEADQYSLEFLDFLNGTIVQRDNGKKRKYPFNLSDAHIESLTFLEFIDLLIGLLRKSSGSYLDGIEASAMDGLGKKILFSFQGNVFKGPLWARLCNRIGRRTFISVLVGLKCILPLENPLANLKWISNSKRDNWMKTTPIKRNKMYYQVRNIVKDVKILHRDTEYLMSEILGVTILKGKVPKKARKMFHVLQNAKSHEEKINYLQMESSLLTQRPISIKVFDNCTHTSEVVRFVLVAVHKMFRTGTFGSHENKAKITSAIVKFVTTFRSERFDVDDLLQSLKVVDVPWLGKTSKATSIQDIHLRSCLFRKFLVFLFDYVVVNIVRTFWYMTENPTNEGGPNIFFPRRVWKELTKKWLSEYISRYLCPVNGPTKDTKTGALTNFGTLRLIPKKSDLRPLCIPRTLAFDKNTVGKLAKYRKEPRSWRSNDLIRPIRDILRYQQVKYHQLYPDTSLGCYSLREVAKRILEFQTDLISKNQVIYGIQFDMKHCYDNLSQLKIISCIEELFSIDASLEVYFLRNVLSHSAGRNSYRKNFNVITTRQNIEELDLFRNDAMANRKDILTDNYKLFKYTKSDIFDLVRSQVIDSTVQIPDDDYKFYKRTRGVFQGLPLLATLCDIVYNSLSDQVILKNKDTFTGKTLFLRLADDFMFLSTSKEDCDRVFENANSHQAQDYGAFVNKDKLKFIDTNDLTNSHAMAFFVGLKIDLKSMSINFVPQTKIRIPSSIKNSLKSHLKHHLCYLGQHLPEYLLNLDYISMDAALENLEKLTMPVQASVIKTITKFRVDQNMLSICELFTHQLTLCIMERWCKINGENHLEPIDLAEKMSEQILNFAIELDRTNR